MGSIEFHIRFNIGIFGADLWGGPDLEIPPGAKVVVVPRMPSDLMLRLCFAITKGIWWWKKTISYNIVFVRSVPLGLVAVMDLEAVGAVYDVA